MNFQGRRRLFPGPDIFQGDFAAAGRQRLAHPGLHFAAPHKAAFRRFNLCVHDGDHFFIQGVGQLPTVARSRTGDELQRKFFVLPAPGCRFPPRSDMGKTAMRSSSVPAQGKIAPQTPVNTIIPILQEDDDSLQRVLQFILNVNIREREYIINLDSRSIGRSDKKT